MFVFYSDSISDSKGKLIGEELHHCIHVLRFKENDVIYATDGKGYLYEGVIYQIKKSELTFEIRKTTFFERPVIQNCIALSPPKSSDRLEWFVEKSIEIGISRILFFESQRTERAKINLTRLEKIAISAIKQSKQYYLPKIDYIPKFEDALHQAKTYKQRFIAYCEEDSRKLKEEVKNGSKIVFIGPEGDFTKEEIELAKNLNILPVSLGNTILRTETAGVYCSVLFQ